MCPSCRSRTVHLACLRPTRLLKAGSISPASQSEAEPPAALWSKTALINSSGLPTGTDMCFHPEILKRPDAVRNPSRPPHLRNGPTRAIRPQHNATGCTSPTIGRAILFSSLFFFSASTSRLPANLTRPHPGCRINPATRIRARLVLGFSFPTVAIARGWQPGFWLSSAFLPTTQLCTNVSGRRHSSFSRSCLLAFHFTPKRVRTFRRRQKSHPRHAPIASLQTHP